MKKHFYLVLFSLFISAFAISCTRDEGVDVQQPISSTLFGKWNVTEYATAETNWGYTDATGKDYHIIIAGPNSVEFKLPSGLFITKAAEYRRTGNTSHEIKFVHAAHTNAFVVIKIEDVGSGNMISAKVTYDGKNPENWVRTVKQ